MSSIIYLWDTLSYYIIKYRTIRSNKHQIILRKLISIAEKADADKPPSITLYDASTLKKKRQLLLPPDREDQGEELAITQFSFDSRYIIAITGEPDWMFYMFRTDKTKLESFCRANNPNGTGTVADVSKSHTRHY